jgi:hypothetical protein
VAEWAARIVLSYAISPSAAIDLTDPADASRMVEQFMLPGICALHDADATKAIDITPFETDTEPFDIDHIDHIDHIDLSDPEPRPYGRTEQGDPS